MMARCDNCGKEFNEGIAWYLFDPRYPINPPVYCSEPCGKECSIKRGMPVTQGEPPSIEGAKEELRRVLGWLDYVPADEFEQVDAIKLIKALDACARVVSALNIKYVDGEDGK